MSDCGAADGLPVMSLSEFEVPLKALRRTRANLERLIAVARSHVMTDEEREAQRQSWVRGELAMGSDRDEARDRQRIYTRNGVVYGLTACVVDPMVRGSFEDGGDVSERQPPGDGQRIIDGLREAVAYERGEATGAKVTTVQVDKRPLIEVTTVDAEQRTFLYGDASTDHPLRSDSGTANRPTPSVRRMLGAHQVRNRSRLACLRTEATREVLRHMGDYIQNAIEDESDPQVLGQMATKARDEWLRPVLAADRDRMIVAAMTWHRENVTLPRAELWTEARMRALVDAMMEAAGG